MHMHTPFVIADCFSVPNKSLYHHGDTILTGTLEHAKAVRPPKMDAR